jgi:cysteinyl-tRNA synthetase
MIAGARVEVAPFKEDPMDFVLWKPSSGQEPGWESPWGKGRPGWHIECSAMAHELLGESFDIHGGGLDLQFPHHENEIAQSACAHPHGDFAHYWLHNEMLQVEGKKMSKSLGNFFTVRDLLDQGIPGEVIRFVFLMTHYRSPMDWTAEKAAQARAKLTLWRRTFMDEPGSAEPDPRIVEALSDDLNTALALTHLEALAASGDPQVFVTSARLLGLLEPGLSQWGWRKVEESFGTVFVAGEGDQDRFFVLVRDFAERWQTLRAVKNFAAADVLRTDALTAGLELKAIPQGVMAQMQPNFDPAKLEALQ